MKGRVEPGGGGKRSVSSRVEGRRTRMLEDQGIVEMMDMSGPGGLGSSRGEGRD